MKNQSVDPEKELRGASTEIEAQRREKQRKLIRRIVLVLCILGGVALGLALREARPKQSPEKSFDADGLLLTLSSRFVESGDRGGFDRAYYSNHEAIFVSVEAVPDEPLQDYAARSVSRLAAGQTAAALTESGLTGFEYQTTEGEKSYACLACFLEGEGRVWTLVFRCRPKDYEEYRPDYIRFAENAQILSERPEP